MRVLYFDSSALLKRVLAEAESEHLADAMLREGDAGSTLVTSRLAEVEVARALQVYEGDLPAGLLAADALSGVAIAPLHDAVLAFARTIGPRRLRSLDALHLATAVALGAHELWTYDDRLTRGAEQVGIRVSAPGRVPS